MAHELYDSDSRIVIRALPPMRKRVTTLVGLGAPIELADDHGHPVVVPVPGHSPIRVWFDRLLHEASRGG